MSGKGAEERLRERLSREFPIETDEGTVVLKARPRTARVRQALIECQPEDVLVQKLRRLSTERKRRELNPDLEPSDETLNKDEQKEVARFTNRQLAALLRREDGGDVTTDFLDEWLDEDVATDWLDFLNPDEPEGDKDGAEKK